MIYHKKVLKSIVSRIIKDTKKIDYYNLSDINKPNQPFEIIGKIKPIFSDGIWTYTEELYEQTYTKACANDTFDYATYIDNNDKAVF